MSGYCLAIVYVTFTYITYRRGEDGDTLNRGLMRKRGHNKGIYKGTICDINETIIENAVKNVLI